MKRLTEQRLQTKTFKSNKNYNLRRGKKANLQSCDFPNWQTENTRIENRIFSMLRNKCYRVCQGSWPSLIVADEDIEPQNFWASSKSHVATTYLCMQFCSNYIVLSNQGKYYEIEVQFTKQDVATWLFDEANIFKFDISVRKQRPTG